MILNGIDSRTASKISAIYKKDSKFLSYMRVL
jgi:hypothetical protein